MPRRNAPPSSNTTAVRLALGQRLSRDSTKPNRLAACRHTVGSVLLTIAAVFSMAAGPTKPRLVDGGRYSCSAVIESSRTMSPIEDYFGRSTVAQSSTYAETGRLSKSTAAPVEATAVLAASYSLGN